MTQEQRRKTKEALGFLGSGTGSTAPATGGGRKPLSKRRRITGRQTPGLRGGILQLRYMERRTREEVMDKLNISYSTYQKLTATF